MAYGATALPLRYPAKLGGHAKVTAEKGPPLGADVPGAVGHGYRGGGFQNDGGGDHVVMVTAPEVALSVQLSASWQVYSTD